MVAIEVIFYKIILIGILLVVLLTAIIRFLRKL